MLAGIGLMVQRGGEPIDCTTARVLRISASYPRRVLGRDQADAEQSDPKFASRKGNQESSMGGRLKPNRSRQTRSDYSVVADKKRERRVS